MMSQHHQAPAEEASSPVMAYPPPVHQAPTPPIGYPTMEVSAYPHNSTHINTKTKGEGFWKGCVAAICCCWVLEFCFGC